MQSNRNPWGAARWLPGLVVVLCSFLGAAHAAGGFTVGAASAMARGGTTVINLRGSYPLLAWQGGEESLQFSARADASFALSNWQLPALGVVAVLGGPRADGSEGYLGLGAGVAPGNATSTGPLMALYALGGVRLPIHAGLRFVIEAQVTRGGGMTVPGVNLGLDYLLGGGR